MLASRMGSNQARLAVGRRIGHNQIPNDSIAPPQLGLCQRADGLAGLFDSTVPLSDNVNVDSRMAEKLHTEIRQDQFAQAALGLVATHGLKGLSVARVAHRVGVVPSAVYRHFASKDELLDAVIGLIRDRLAQNVLKASQECKDALGCLQRLLMLHAQLIRENQGAPRIVFSEETFSGNPHRKAAVHEIVRGYLKRVADMVRRGQEEGQIRHDLDPTTVSLMFLGLVQPAAILWQLSDGGIDVTKHAERAWQIFAEAIRAR